MRFSIDKIKFSKLYIIEQTDEKWFITLVQNKKSELSILDHFNLNINDNTLENVDIKIPVIICINNNEVLLKKRKLTNNSSVQNSFPSIKLNDFYYESIKTIDNSYLDLIIRKTRINKYLSNLEKLGMNIIQYHLGFYNCFSLIKNTDLDDVWIHDTIVNFNKDTPKQQLLDNIKLNPENTNGFAVAFQYYTESTIITTNEELKKESYKNNYYNLFLFNKITLISSLVLFTILILNTLLYYHLLKETDILKQKVFYENTQVNKSNNLKKQIKRKKDFLLILEQNKNKNSSILIDKLTKTIPNGISLNYFKLQPTAKQIDSKKPIEIIKKTIYIDGVTDSEKKFNKWIKVLENTSNIININVNNYSESLNLSKFTIEIKFLTNEN